MSGGQQIRILHKRCGEQQSTLGVTNMLQSGGLACVIYKYVDMQSQVCVCSFRHSIYKLLLASESSVLFEPISDLYSAFLCVIILR